MNAERSPEPQILAPKKPPRAYRRRYYRVLVFFARAFAHFFWHDVVLARPILRSFRSDPIQRWRRVARRYRALAVRWGGVLIKLGQYLSTRVDVLPVEVTRELSGLQDEVPPEDFADIRAQVEAELGEPLQEIFTTFMDRPLGAASFAQVHEAQLPDGRPVVVKVLRPGIEEVVETDLMVIGRAFGWLEWWPAVRRRVDVGWLRDEFSTTTRRELDLLSEGRHAERFAENFAGDDGVHVPEIYWQHSSRKVLTEENVGYIKVGDLEGMRAAGIDPGEVAKKLYRVYMEQIFSHHFVHADPHPGNIFVRPTSRQANLADEVMARAEEAAAAVGVVDEAPPPPFQILFVDFGMVAEIPPRLRAALRKLLIGIGARDAGQVIQSLRDAGSLLPGADLPQLEEALDQLFDRFWGVDLADMNRMVLSDASALWKEFGQLLLETPIQVQVDLMFTTRALELLSGISQGLDKDFNPWSEAVPFAERLAVEAAKDWRVQATELARQLRLLAKLPGEVSRTATLAQRGRLVVRSAMAPDMRRQMQRLERSVDHLGRAVTSTGLVIAGAMLYPEDPRLAAGAAGLGVLIHLWGRLPKL
ncbi:MAG: AarF/UbiB family protein [Acidobacteriota bacterium]